MHYFGPPRCLLSAILIAAFAVMGQAQEQYRCRDILLDGMQGKLDVTRDEFDSKVLQWMCSNREGTRNLTNNLKAGFIAGVPSEFGGDLTGDETKAWFASHCGENPPRMPAKQADAVAAQLAPLPTAEHWLACITHSAFDWQLRVRRTYDARESAVDLTADIDGPSVRLTAVWRPQPWCDHAPKITDLEIFGADCPVEKSGFAIGKHLDPTTTMNCTRQGTSAMGFALSTSHTSAGVHFPGAETVALEAARVASVAMPPGSMDGGRAVEDQVWSAKFPLDDPDKPGIGLLVLPEKLPDTHLALHDHHFLKKGTNILDSKRSNFTYEFDRETTVLEVEMLQHNNAVAKIQGFAGDSKGSLASVGVATIDAGCAVPEYYESQHCVFTFPNPRKGKFFRVEMLETNSTKGLAVFRAFPRGTDHRRYLPKD